MSREEFNEPRYGFTGTRLNRHGALAISLRKAKTSGKPGIWERRRREERGEKARNSFNFQRGHRQQPSFGCAGWRWSGKPIRGNLLDSPSTDMPQEIPRVFSQRSLLSSLGQSFSPVVLFPFPFLPHATVALSFHVLATRSLASLFHAARDVAFPDLFRLYGSFQTEIPLDCQSFSEAIGYPAKSRRPHLPSFDRLISQ